MALHACYARSTARADMDRGRWRCCSPASRDILLALFTIPLELALDIWTCSEHL